MNRKQWVLMVGAAVAGVGVWTSAQFISGIENAVQTIKNVVITNNGLPGGEVILDINVQDNKRKNLMGPNDTIYLKTGAIQDGKIALEDINWSGFFTTSQLQCNSGEAVAKVNSNGSPSCQNVASYWKRVNGQQKGGAIYFPGKVAIDSSATETPVNASDFGSENLGNPSVPEPVTFLVKNKGTSTMTVNGSVKVGDDLAISADDGHLKLDAKKLVFSVPYMVLGGRGDQIGSSKLSIHNDSVQSENLAIGQKTSISVESSSSSIDTKGNKFYVGHKTLGSNNPKDGLAKFFGLVHAQDTHQPTRVVVGGEQTYTDAMLTVRGKLATRGVGYEGGLRLSKKLSDTASKCADGQKVLSVDGRGNVVMKTIGNCEGVKHEYERRVVKGCEGQKNEGECTGKYVDKSDGKCEGYENISPCIFVGGGAVSHDPCEDYALNYKCIVKNDYGHAYQSVACPNIEEMSFNHRAGFSHERDTNYMYKCMCKMKPNIDVDAFGSRGFDDSRYSDVYNVHDRAVTLSEAKNYASQCSTYATQKECEDTDNIGTLWCSWNKKNIERDCSGLSRDECGKHEGCELVDAKKPKQIVECRDEAGKKVKDELCENATGKKKVEMEKCEEKAGNKDLFGFLEDKSSCIENFDYAFLFDEGSTEAYGNFSLYDLEISKNTTGIPYVIKWESRQSDDTYVLRKKNTSDKPKSGYVDIQVTKIGNTSSKGTMRVSFNNCNNTGNGSSNGSNTGGGGGCHGAGCPEGPIRGSFGDGRPNPNGGGGPVHPNGPGRNGGGNPGGGGGGSSGGGRYGGGGGGHP